MPGGEKPHFHTVGQFCGLLDRADNILVTAAQEISLPTIKTFMSGNELWNVNSLAIVTANMDHWDDKAHLTDEIKQKNILIAGAAPALLCTTAGRTFRIFMEKDSINSKVL